MEIRLTDYSVDPTTGFLPSPDPLRQLPAPFAAWDEVGADLPALLNAMNATLHRMYENCDPHIFFTRIRPFLASWPEPGVVYEGVSETPLVFAGGSAGQSSLVQALDAALSVRHTDARSSPFLMEMRHYMPPPHRKFVEALEAGPDVHAFVKTQAPQLVEAYNTCINLLTQFRKQHMEIAVRYITKQMPANEEAKGTGGTSLAQFLGATKQETRERRM